MFKQMEPPVRRYTGQNLSWIPVSSRFQISCPASDTRDGDIDKNSFVDLSVFDIVKKRIKIICLQKSGRGKFGKIWFRVC